VTIWTREDVEKILSVADKQNETKSDAQKFQYNISSSNSEPHCHLHVVTCEDVELALSMDIKPSLRHTLMSRSEWKGGWQSQSANRTCCKKQQDAEIEFITVQVMKEDDDGNALTTVKPDVAAVLQTTRKIQPGEFLRYQYTDRSEHLKKMFAFTFLWQSQGPKSMLTRLEVALKQFSPAMGMPKMGKRVTVKTAGVAQGGGRVLTT